MAEEESQVKLYGFWASPFVLKVIWALKLKKIEYEYIEEDLSSKSPSLLRYNPVHKAVPVLVHGGRPVAESDVILEYIEETWPDRRPALLPADPYERAMARFWIGFVQEKRTIFFEYFLCTEENKREATDQLVETLKIIQDQSLGDKKFFGGEEIGLVDLSFGWLIHWLDLMQQLVGSRVIEPTSLPKLHRWAIDFENQPEIKENLPDPNALLAHFEKYKKSLTSTS